MAQDPQNFTIGDRVVILGLQNVNAQQFNNKHGTIATDLENGRYGVDLDMMPLQPRVRAKPTNLIQEEPIALERNNSRAKVQNNILEELQGRALAEILDLIRFGVASMLTHDPTIKSQDDIGELRTMGQSGLSKQNSYTGMAWENWLSTTSEFQGVPGIYAYTCRTCKIDTPYEDPSIRDNDRFQLIDKACEDIAAVGGWHMRVCGYFWIVGKSEDGTGTYMVSSQNEGLVYKVLGMSNCIHTMIAPNYGDEIPQFSVVLLPWNGRIVYDGVITPAPSKNGQYWLPPVAKPDVAQRLRNAVEKAELEGRVIDRFRELELENSSSLLPDIEDYTTDEFHQRMEDAIQKPSPSSIDGASSLSRTEIEKAETNEERVLLDRIQRYSKEPVADDDMSTISKREFWIYRRMGYTEAENPCHIGMMMRGQFPGNDQMSSPTSMPFGTFQCSSLKPTSTDILSSLDKESSTHRHLPYNLMLDGKEVFERIKFLLQKRSMGIRVMYYPPPSNEETNAYMKSHPRTGHGRFR